MTILFLLAGISMFPVYSATSSDETEPRYKKEDCIKCHAGVVNDLKTGGRRHRAVPCMGCHVGHPPGICT